MIFLSLPQFTPDFSDPTTLILCAWFLFSLGAMIAILIWRGGKRG